MTHCSMHYVDKLSLTFRIARPRKGTYVGLLEIVCLPAMLQGSEQAADHSDQL